MKNWEPLPLGPAFCLFVSVVYLLKEKLLGWIGEGNIGEYTYSHRQKTRLIMLEDEILIIECLQSIDTR